MADKNNANATEIEITPEILNDLSNRLLGAVDFDESIFEPRLLAKMILESSFSVLRKYQYLNSPIQDINQHCK